LADLELVAARARIAELEYILRHFDRSSMDLHHYVRAVEGVPSKAEWELVRDQVKEMVDAYGLRNPYGPRSVGFGGVETVGPA
jgi:hypothetical protein